MRFLAASLLFFVSVYSYGQGIKEFPDLKLDNTLFIEKNNPEEAEKVKETPVKKIDIKSEYWDSQRFNPYKDALVKFPLKLEFKDILYASPLLDEKVITSRFGWRRGRPHKGIDIDLHTGDEVVSILDGIVRFVNYNSGHGKTVIVRHFNGLETAYAHLSAYAVKVNDTVRRGQILGKGGATGNARGSHLHLVTSYKGIAINPEYLFDFSQNNRIRSSEIWVTRRWTDPYHHSSKRRSKMELLLTKDEALASLTKEKKIYVVKRGDTLSHISRRNNVSIRAICVANNIKSTTLLKIGQKLVLEL